MLLEEVLRGKMTYVENRSVLIMQPIITLVARHYRLHGIYYYNIHIMDLTDHSINYFLLLFENFVQEIFIVVFLDNQNRLISY